MTPEEIKDTLNRIIDDEKVRITKLDEEISAEYQLITKHTDKKILLEKLRQRHVDFTNNLNASLGLFQEEKEKS
jgi:hypothetical protein